MSEVATLRTLTSLSYKLCMISDFKNIFFENVSILLVWRPRSDLKAGTQLRGGDNKSKLRFAKDIHQIKSLDKKFKIV